MNRLSKPRKQFLKLRESFEAIEHENYYGDTMPVNRIGTGISTITPDYSDIIRKLLEMNTQIRVYHWQTRAYAAHQALGGFYDFLSTFTDEFVEKLMGEHGDNGVISMKSQTYNTSNLRDLNDIKSYLTGCERYFMHDIKLILNPNSTENEDLYNMIQELTSEIKKLKYLLHLS